MRLFTLIVILAFYGCQIDPGEPDAINPNPIGVKSRDEIKSDSIAAVFGLETKNLRRITVYHLDSYKNFHLAAQQGDMIWLGIFRPDKSIIVEKSINTQSTHKYNKPRHNLNISPIELDNYVFYRISTIEDAELGGQVSSNILTIVKPDLVKKVVEFVSEHTSSGKSYSISSPLYWVGGFLFKRNSLGGDLNPGVVFIEDSFEKIQSWDVRIGYEPNSHSIAIRPSHFLGITNSDLFGYDFITKNFWKHSLQEFFGFTNCNNCSVSVELIEKNDSRSILKLTLSNRYKRLKVDNVSGEVISLEDW